MKGKVEQFDPAKGFGWIVGEDGVKYFFHWTSIVMEGYKTAEVGEEVEFEEGKTERGPRANNVRKAEAK